MGADDPMRTLIVGAGALGGLLATRLLAAGCAVELATRSAESAAVLRGSGLRVTGVGGDAASDTPKAGPLTAFAADRFDLIVLATKAHDALALAPQLADLLAPGGTLLPVQNGGVSQILAEQLGRDRVLGGLSNLGATMIGPGRYEQRNAGHLLIGELAGGASRRAARIRAWLAHGVEVRTTPNMIGAIWSKLLLNCSVTTIGAIAGATMREYIARPEGRELFDRVYAEALAVARAAGATLERMLVDPVPPVGPAGQPDSRYETWLAQIVDSYGDVKPSMLQDFERGRPTEIGFINGYVVDVGRRLGVRVPINTAIVETVHAITRGQLVPNARLLGQVLQSTTERIGLPGAR